MIIKANHRHVDQQGLCYLPYLNQWNAGSNLAILVSTMSVTFSQDPPLFTRPREPTPPIPNPILNAMPPRPAPQVVHAVPDPEEALKREGVRRVSEKARARVAEENSKAAAELEQMYDKQRTLAAAGESLRQRLDALRREKEEGEESAALLASKQESVDRWLAEHAGQENTPIDVEAALLPKDPLARQLLELVAEDSAMEDGLYWLEKALIQQNIDQAAFLREVRSLSREQFLKKALAAKVRAALVSQPPAAAR
eukprot:tig00021374_g21096.t1